ncbi:formate dehydrogenase subunit delta [Marinobacter salinisoli]|uniref:Formate dehydrogenase subunit delta n=1 Tax=Marinobacter salinisoli TaxID=2769486 RepID=A0ABX7MTG2_9GAMM|nr:formate dehydrogenase subunit delta [Marinobacter salinisoli]QSP95677.1 formate dehydrogenase subunit delta [Marinobacter salinisoli]
MTDQELAHLIQMLNQISANNIYHGDEARAADTVATHLRKFWARSMRQKIIAYAGVDGTELSNVSRLAVARLNADTRTEV